MTATVTVIPRQTPVTAMRFIAGVTTKSAILAFCPRANVGVLMVDGVDQEKDIRWVAVPHNGDLWDRVEHDGDWIVQKAPGHYFTMTDIEFHREYVMP